MNLHVSDVSQKLKKAVSDLKKTMEENGLSDKACPTKIIVNNSGGKDSGATNLIAREAFGDDYESVAADTGNEHPLTIEHLEALHHQVGGKPVRIVKADYPEEMFDKRSEKVNKQWKKKQKVLAGAYRGIIMPSLDDPNSKFTNAWREVAIKNGFGEFNTPLEAFNSVFKKSGNPFLDMSLLHGGFPLGRQRFCTDELKMQVVWDLVVEPDLEARNEVLQLSGVRAEESEKRAGYDVFSEDKRDPLGRVFNYLPIHDWTASDVFALYKYFGVKPNPLYSQGMDRVGCMPCILVSKPELAEIALRFPEEIERVAKWERQVAMTSRWVHWMMVGHVNRRQFKGLESSNFQFERFENIDGEELTITKTNKKPSKFRFGYERKFNRIYKLDVEAYSGTSMLGPRGNIIGGNVYDAVEWSRTARGGKTYDLVTASLSAEKCSSKYGLCE